jgi:hypothetical protein
MHWALMDIGVLFVLVPIRCETAAHVGGAGKKNKGQLSLSYLVHTTCSFTSRLSGQCDLSEEFLFTQYSGSPAEMVRSH